MIQKLLHLKHWQIFLFYALPGLISILALAAIFAIRIHYGDTEGPQGAILPLVILYFVGPLFVIGVALSWLWAIAVGLQPKLPEGMNMNLNTFKIAFCGPIVVILVAAFAMLSGWEGLVFIAVLFLAWVCAMVGVFYVPWFVARTLKSVELQRTDLGFSEVILDYFLIHLGPIGVWFIQPRINRAAA